MVQIIVYLDEEEDYIVKHYAREWNLSKMMTVRRIVREYAETKGRKKLDG